ncbi:MAG: cysteine desulfurase [Alphaproteobacteria bacterium]|nr:MAG: cysteine desulfurase [Alphaproteobacteria bacterium]
MLTLFALCVKDHNETIYADYAATTPCHPKVVKKMEPYWGLPYGNANSKHAFGLKAKHAIQKAKTRIARLIKADPEEIVFTSGATEANHIAIRQLNKKTHIITSVIEHKSVLYACKNLDIRITYVPVKKDGRICLDTLEKSITADTGLVSIMWVNNETGIIQPIQEIAAICRKHNIPFHTDASQAVGKVDIDAHMVDAMSFTAHKIYGPQGVGALYVRKGLHIERSGTPPTALCIGFGAACKLMMQTPYPTEYYERFYKALQNYGVILNGDNKYRVPDVFNVRFQGKIPAEFIKNVAMSQGSACLKEPSYVLREMGLTEDEIAHSFRISLSRFVTEDEVDALTSVITS